MKKPIHKKTQLTIIDQATFCWQNDVIFYLVRLMIFLKQIILIYSKGIQHLFYELQGS